MFLVLFSLSSSSRFLSSLLFIPVFFSFCFLNSMIIFYFPPATNSTTSSTHPHNHSLLPLTIHIPFTYYNHYHHRKLHQFATPHFSPLRLLPPSPPLHSSAHSHHSRPLRPLPLLPTGRPRLNTQASSGVKSSLRRRNFTDRFLIYLTRRKIKCVVGEMEGEGG